MRSSDVGSDTDILAEFWTEWAGNTDYFMFRMSEFVGKQERLVRQVLERCPQGDDRESCGESPDLVSGRSCGEPLLSDQASSAAYVSLDCIVVEVDGVRGRRGGETLTAATCLETGGTSEHTVSAGGSLKGSEERRADPLQAPSCTEPSGVRAAEVTEAEPSGFTGGSPEKSKRRIPPLSTKYEQLLLVKSSRKKSKECEADEAWQSRYDELTAVSGKQRAVDRTLRMGGILPARMLYLLQLWFQLEEPPRQGCIQNVIGHTMFQFLTCLFIFMNTGFAIYVSDYSMEHVGAHDPNEAYVEGAFLFFFTCEICLKIWVHKLYFFLNDEVFWNIFDCVLILISLIDVSATLSQKQGNNLTFARVLRIFKAGRVLRMFRAVKFLQSLRVILVALIHSFATFVWSVAVMFLICFTFALLFVQTIGGFQSDALHDGQVDSVLWEKQQQYFGTVGQGTFTLLMVASGGAGWDTAHDLIKPLGSVINAAFVFFLIFFNFALINLLAGMFLDTVVKLAAPDSEEQITEAWRQEAQDLADLRRIVEAMDVEESSAITKDAFIKCCSYPHVQLSFAKVGIDVSHSEDFFSAVADGQERVLVEDFIAGAVHMTRSVTNAEMQRLVGDVRSLHQQMSKIPVIPIFSM